MQRYLGHWPPILSSDELSSSELPHSTEGTASAFSPAMDARHNQRSNFYIHTSLGAQPTYNYGTATDRLPQQPYSSTPGAMEPPPRPSHLFPVTQAAEPTYSGSTLDPFITASSAGASTAPVTRPNKRVRGPRTQRKAASEWEKYKPVIEEFYMKQNKKLEQLREFMRDKYEFDAT